MHLPNAEQTTVDASKVRDYLLSTDHPIGRFKAAFFRSLGFSVTDWPALQRALVVHGQTGDAAPEAPSPYGQKFRVQGMLQGPAGRTALVVSVWIVRPGVVSPHFVTAFPGAAR
jgi:hypothetical protein